MDRNLIIYDTTHKKKINVALRKESVDRNLTWHCMSEDVSVALRKESVDRNLQKLAEAINPSVALRKESVDRNSEINTRGSKKMSRSPQGERG